MCASSMAVHRRSLIINMQERKMARTQNHKILFGGSHIKKRHHAKSCHVVLGLQIELGGNILIQRAERDRYRPMPQAHNGGCGYCFSLGLSVFSVVRLDGEALLL